MGLNLGQSFVVYSICFCCLCSFTSYMQGTFWVEGLWVSFCNYPSTWSPAWLQEVATSGPISPLLGVLAGVSPIDTLRAPNFPGHWYIQNIVPPQLPIPPFFFHVIPIFDPLPKSPLHPLSNPVPFLQPRYQFYFPFWERFNHTSLDFACYLPSSACLL